MEQETAGYLFSRGMGPRKARSRTLPNKLRDWLEHVPPPMRKSDFAKAIGVSPAYVSMMLSDEMPWPRREIVQRIVEVTDGEVTANDLIIKPGS